MTGPIVTCVSGKQALRRLREQMRRRVADDVERVGAFLGDDFELRVVIDRETGVDELAVDLAGERGLGEARADRGGDVLHRGRVLELFLAAVGERDVDHDKSIDFSFARHSRMLLSGIQ